MFGIGGFELFLILLFGFLVFGPDKLPEIAKTVGRAIAKFRDAQAEVTSTLQNVAFDKDSDTPFKNPFDAADKMKTTAQRSATAAKDVASSVKASAAKPTAEAASAVGDDRAKVAADGADAASEESPRESFSERKARYERERKARAQAPRPTEARADAKKAADSKDAPAAMPTDVVEKGGA